MLNSYNYEEYVEKEPDKVFNLISDFTQYKNFLPGCIKSEVLSSYDDYEIGELKFNFFGKEYFIESQNYKYPNELRIKQIQGPFNRLDAKWQVFEKDSGSLISFSTNFEAPFFLKPFINQTTIDAFANKLIHAFLERIS